MISKKIMKQFQELDYEVCLAKRGGKWCQGHHLIVNTKRLVNAIWNAYGGDIDFETIVSDEHALSDALNALFQHDDYWKGSSQDEMEDYIREYWKT